MGKNRFHISCERATIVKDGRKTPSTEWWVFKNGSYYAGSKKGWTKDQALIHAQDAISEDNRK